MTRYLLDTSALIDFSKDQASARRFVLEAIDAGDELGVSPINAAEFYAGLSPRERAGWDRFFADLSYWPISLEAARQAGVWRYQFGRQGATLTITDTLTAAVATEQKAILVTGNVRDFPMQEVELLTLTP